MWNETLQKLRDAADEALGKEDPLAFLPENYDAARADEHGDTLLKFVVVEMAEGSQDAAIVGNWDYWPKCKQYGTPEAIKAAVLKCLERAQMDLNVIVNAMRYCDVEGDAE